MSFWGNRWISLDYEQTGELGHLFTETTCLDGQLRFFLSMHSKPQQPIAEKVKAATWLSRWVPGFPGWLPWCLGSVFHVSILKMSTAATFVDAKGPTPFAVKFFANFLRHPGYRREHIHAQRPTQRTQGTSPQRPNGCHWVASFKGSDCGPLFANACSGTHINTNMSSSARCPSFFFFFLSRPF